MIHKCLIAYAPTHCFTRRPLSPPRSSRNSSKVCNRSSTPVLSGVTDADEAYVFQQSPYRAIRRNIFAPSATQGNTVVSSDALSDNVTVTGSSKDLSTRTGSAGKKARNDFLPNMSPDLNMQDHDELVNYLLSVQGDPLQEYGGRIVTFRGSPQARLMIIGEAPGEQEDKLGIPFVGRAGQLLDKIFTYGGFNVETQVYITNVVKRRPPNNRDPTAEEISYFLPYLQEEIRLIDPVIIILAGNIATKSFLGQDVRITQVRGTWFGGQLGNPWIMPIFHPSYLLRNETQKLKMVTDIEAIRAKYIQLQPDDALSPLRKARESA